MDNTEIKLKGDLLNRGEYALGLYNIIGEYDVEKEVSGQFAKPTDNKALIMSISARWGFGKTAFVHLFKSVLTKAGIEEGADQFEDQFALSDSEIEIYNAWQSDYSDDPLMPLFHILLNMLYANGNNGGEIRKLWNALVKKDTSYDVTNTLLPMAEKNIRQYLKTEFADSRIETVRSLIEARIKQTEHKKIVIIIDELDRCRPTFAVQTLEIVKHLFNIPGIVFIFALDFSELQHCVRVVYGNEFDAIGYLRRFFDYSTFMPEVNQEQLFNKIAEEFRILSEGESAESYYQICNDFHLSIREIRAVCFSFHYLISRELKDYPIHLVKQKRNRYCWIQK